MRALRGQAGALVGLAGALPAGGGDPAWLIALAERMAGGGAWVEHPATWIVAADFDSGERVAFGAPGAPRATIAEALCASWALPSWMPPVHVGGHRYADGGILSPASADVLAGLGLDEVVVLAPMCSSDPGRPVGLLARGERLMRRQMTRVLEPWSQRWSRRAHLSSGSSPAAVTSPRWARTSWTRGAGRQRW